MDKIGDLVDRQIENAIKHYDGSFDCTFNKLSSCDFETLITFSEIVDMLSICNFKLFTLKNLVQEKNNDKEFCSWAANEDIKLCLQRSRLKTCLDKKISAIILKMKLVGKTGINEETKIYGNELK